MAAVTKNVAATSVANNNKRKLKIALDYMLPSEDIVKKLKEYCDVELICNEKVDSDTVFVGSVLNTANRKKFNISRFSIALCSDKMSCGYADENIVNNLSIIDYIHFIPALVAARLFGDTDETVIEKIKKDLARLYSMDGTWTAHADPKWKKDKSVYLTVYRVIKELINSTRYSN